MLIEESMVDHVDHQAHSVFLRDGRRIGFAAARRAGLDPEGWRHLRGVQMPRPSAPAPALLIDNTAADAA